MDRFSSSSSKCVFVWTGGVMAMVTIVMLVIFLVLSNDGDSRQNRSGFYFAFAFVSGTIVTVILLAILWKIVCSPCARDIQFPEDSDKCKIKRTDKCTEKECCICLEKKEPDSKLIVKLKCGHDFHKDCILKSFQYNIEKRCPLCRKISESYSTAERFTSLIKYFASRIKKTETHNNGDETWV